MDTNAAGSSAAKSSDEKIAAVAHWRESPLFSEAEKAALAFAEAMTDTPAEVPAHVFEAARQRFSVEQLAELAATAAMENYRARFNRAFAVEPQHLYQPRSAEPPASS